MLHVQRAEAAAQSVSASGLKALDLLCRGLEKQTLQSSLSSLAEMGAVLGPIHEVVQIVRHDQNQLQWKLAARDVNHLYKAHPMPLVSMAAHLEWLNQMTELNDQGGIGCSTIMASIMTYCDGRMRECRATYSEDLHIDLLANHQIKADGVP